MTLAPSPDDTTAAPIEPAGLAMVIDDHPLFCDALELTLRSLSDYSDVHTADCLESALAFLEDGPKPVLILLDLNLPDVSGLDGLMRLRRQTPHSKIIVVSSMTDNAIITGAIAAGASGFVPKHSHRSVFREAIDQIKTGAVFTPTGFVQDGANQDHNEAYLRLASLTNQQSRILELICEGKLNKQIAYDLSIAETTVKAHVTAIMRKLEVQSRTQAVLVAHDAKFFNIAAQKM